ncbi:ABC transporter permease [Mycolicibacterium wolinskyi]|uniref:ABC transporter permease n=1 Tax=Mycolicibacterium wolinskyi TaxID=59750 RepID=A0A1X2F8T8_9MYCO|nr:MULTISPECIES: ABC transporter permease [Mycolicibacterium]MCV7286440.1 ABC transporter permease [Mycolicibacterium wolinskyi]MCV7293420.1 ABC transporter permease [Mycolicibacterium goodii]ORX14827.1 ABC transporter permease [Mycolicibacterium wolinskyi]
MNTSMITEILSSGVAFAIPLLLAAAGESISERAGVLNLSMEGMMLTGAFAGVLAAVSTGSAILGAIAGIVAGLIFGLAQALWSVRFRADQIVVGIAANALALGLTAFGARTLLGDGKGHDVPAFSDVHIPVLSDLPVIGPALFGQTLLGYFCVAAIVALTVLFSNRTMTGMRIDAVGEDAVSAGWTGLPVNRIRVVGVLVASGAGGLAGAQLALSEVRAFSENMTAGMGYLAVVAVIAGHWRVIGILWAALFFGVARALQFALPAVGVHIPYAVLVMLPYVIAIVAISGFVGGRKAPSCLTVPYVGRV